MVSGIRAGCTGRNKYAYMNDDVDSIADAFVDADFHIDVDIIYTNLMLIYNLGVDIEADVYIELMLL